MESRKKQCNSCDQICTLYVLGQSIDSRKSQQVLFFPPSSIFTFLPPYSAHLGLDTPGCSVWSAANTPLFAQQPLHMQDLRALSKSSEHFFNPIDLSHTLPFSFF